MWQLIIENKYQEKLDTYNRETKGDDGTQNATYSFGEHDRN